MPNRTNAVTAEKAANFAANLADVLIPRSFNVVFVISYTIQSATKTTEMTPMICTISIPPKVIQFCLSILA
jgi:hypothetical protein